MTGMEPIGTVTDRDITIRVVAGDYDPKNLRAADIMTKNVATVTPEMSVEKCLEVMEDKEIRRVLVVNSDGKCCGIVAQADIVRSTEDPLRTNKVIRDISGSAPSQHRGVSVSRESNDRGYSTGLHEGSYGLKMKNSSFMSTQSLLPLVIGLGSGIAVGYLASVRQKNYQRQAPLPLSTFSHEDRMDVTDPENFGKYADADEEILRRQHHVEDRMHTLRTEPTSPINEHTEVDTPEFPSASIGGKSRSAGQS